MALDIGLLSYEKDGLITLSVNTSIYSYCIDGAMLFKWLPMLCSKWSRRRMVAFLEIKKSCLWYKNETTGVIIDNA